MIIDLILDRKDNEEEGVFNYNPREFYHDVLGYGEIGHDITFAMDIGTEECVKRTLREYIINNGYNPDICDYINSVNWLEGGATA